MRYTLLSLILLPVLPALAQSGETDILDIISASAVQQQVSQEEIITESQGTIFQSAQPQSTIIPESNVETGSPLDFVKESSPLDFVETSSAVEYVEDSPLDYINGGVAETSDSGIGVLEAITGAYAMNSFYAAGAWSNLRSTSAAARYGNYNGYGNSFAGVYGSFAATSAEALYDSPEWGHITSGFGYRSKFKRVHKGIDIAMAVGDTVRVVMPGVIARTGYEARGYGHYIVVKHDDGMETRYAHLSIPLVASGQRVAAHEAIALSGNTGNSTGPHLHFETRFNGMAVDPTTVFDFAGSGHNLYNASYADAYGNYAPKNNNKIAAGSNASKNSINGKRTYIIRQGDTLEKIAERAGISLMRLCQINGILDNELPATGTMLRLR